MSELAQTKQVLTQMLALVDMAEKAGSYATVTEQAESRYALAKRQEAEVKKEHDTIIEKAQAEGQRLRAAAAADVATAQGEHARYVKGLQDRAKAELDNIAQQRSTLDAEIAALHKQAIDLRAQVDEQKQELGKAKDAAAAAHKQHEQAQAQLAQMRDSLAHAS